MSVIHMYVDICREMYIYVYIQLEHWKTMACTAAQFMRWLTVQKLALVLHQNQKRPSTTPPNHYTHDYTYKH